MEDKGFTSFLARFAFLTEAEKENAASPFDKHVDTFKKSSEEIANEFKKEFGGKKFKDLQEPEDINKAKLIFKKYNELLNGFTEKMEKEYDALAEKTPRGPGAINNKQTYSNAVATKMKVAREALAVFGISKAELDKALEVPKKKFSLSDFMKKKKPAYESSFTSIVNDIYDAYMESEITKEEAEVLLEEVGVETFFD